MTDLHKLSEEWRKDINAHEGNTDMDGFCSGLRWCADELERALSAQGEAVEIGHPRREGEDRDEIELFLRDAYAAGGNAIEGGRVRSWVTAAQYAAREAPALRAKLSAQGEAVSALALKFLVAGGFVTQAKADEAMTIASGYTHPAPRVEVDEAMVERAHAAYGNACYLGAPSTKVAMKCALTAALNPEAGRG